MFPQDDRSAATGGQRDIALSSPKGDRYPAIALPAAVLFASFAFTACALLGGGIEAFAATATPNVVDGPTVEKLIDRQFVPELRVQSAAIPIGASSCPKMLDLENHRSGRCYLDVSGQRLPLAVSRGNNGRLTVRNEAALYFVPDLERKLGVVFFAHYGTRLRISCGSPNVRVVAPGTTVRCALSGSAAAGTSLSFRVDDARGNVTFEPSTSTGQTSPFEPYFKSARGDSVTVPGRRLAEIVRSRVLALGAQALPASFIGAVSCPEPSVLTRTVPVTCTIGTTSGDVRVAIVRTDDDISETPIDEVIDTKHIDELGSSFYQRKLAAGGFPGTASVDCGAPRIVILAPSASITCILTATGSAPRPLLVRPGLHGAVNFDVPPRPRV